MGTSPVTGRRGIGRLPVWASSLCWGPSGLLSACSSSSCQTAGPYSSLSASCCGTPPPAAWSCSSPAGRFWCPSSSGHSPAAGWSGCWWSPLHGAALAPVPPGSPGHCGPADGQTSSPPPSEDHQHWLHEGERFLSWVTSTEWLEAQERFIVGSTHSVSCSRLWPYWLWWKPGF